MPSPASRGRKPSEEDGEFEGAKKQTLPDKPRSGTRKKNDAAKPKSNTDDIMLSAHYACTPCGLSFEPPTPQLFSFNSRTACARHATDWVRSLVLIRRY